MIICCDYRIENRDGRWMVLGRTMSGSRFLAVGCYVRREPGLWINRNLVDCEAMCDLCDIDWLWSVWMCYMQTPCLLCHQVSYCEWGWVWKRKLLIFV